MTHFVGLARGANIGRVNMRIIIPSTGRWIKNIKVKNMILRHSEVVARKLPLLAKRFKFKLPDKIVVRPLDIRSPYSSTAGRCTWNYFEGYTIALNPLYCISNPRNAKWVVDHEISHVAAALRHNDWSHGRVFDEIHNYCKNI